MRILAVLFPLVLYGCAGMSSVVERQDALLAPKQFQAGSQEDAYRAASKIARAAYDESLKAPGANPVVAQVIAGIATVNGKCREWLAEVNMADVKFSQGAGNIGVMQGLLSGGAAAIGMHRDFLTFLGLGGATYAGWEANFRASVLAMANHGLQSKMLEVMAIRAQELRGEAAQLTWPDAVDALEGYKALCTRQAAQAAASSAMNATTTKATPAGTLQSVAK